MMTEIRMKNDHQIIKGRQVIEIWNKGILKGCIYPTDEGFRFMTKFEHKITSPQAGVLEIDIGDKE